MAEKIRRHMKISGRVQGVGFRFRAYHVAEMLRVTGWVKNEYDGTVEMEIQGTHAQIGEFMRMMNADHYIIIDDVDWKDMSLVEEERSFSIR